MKVKSKDDSFICFICGEFQFFLSSMYLITIRRVCGVEEGARGRQVYVFQRTDMRGFEERGKAGNGTGEKECGVEGVAEAFR